MSLHSHDPRLGTPGVPRAPGLDDGIVTGGQLLHAHPHSHHPHAHHGVAGLSTQQMQPTQPVYDAVHSGQWRGDMLEPMLELVLEKGCFRGLRSKNKDDSGSFEFVANGLQQLGYPRFSENSLKKRLRHTVENFEGISRQYSESGVPETLYSRKIQDALREISERSHQRGRPKGAIFRRDNQGAESPRQRRKDLPDDSVLQPYGNTLVTSAQMDSRKRKRDSEPSVEAVMRMTHDLRKKLAEHQRTLTTMFETRSQFFGSEEQRDMMEKLVKTVTESMAAQHELFRQMMDNQREVLNNLLQHFSPSQ